MATKLARFNFIRRLFNRLDSAEQAIKVAWIGGGGIGFGGAKPHAMPLIFMRWTESASDLSVVVEMAGRHPVGGMRKGDGEPTASGAA